MTEFKKKSASITSIADEVAALHGLTKSTMRPLTKSVFTALVNQLFEKGRVSIPGLGSLNLEFSIKSGAPTAFTRVRLHKKVRDREKQMFLDPANLSFVNYVLQRDEKIIERRETSRLGQIEFGLKKRQYRIDNERIRVAAAIKATTGQEIDPESISEEYLIPPRANTARLPEHRIEVRDLIATAGVFPLEKLYHPTHQPTDTPPDQPTTGHVPAG